jgi:hypothetical protein
VAWCRADQFEHYKLPMPIRRAFSYVQPDTPH